MGILCMILLIIGILAVSAGDNALWPSGGLCVLWLFVYSLTIGPIAVSGSACNSLLHLETLTGLQYSIISETSSVRLRPLSVVLARNAYQLTNIVSQVLQAYMM